MTQTYELFVVMSEKGRGITIVVFYHNNSSILIPLLSRLIAETYFLHQVLNSKLFLKTIIKGKVK